MFTTAHAVPASRRLFHLVGAGLVVAAVLVPAGGSHAAAGTSTNQAFTVVSIPAASSATTQTILVQRTWDGPEFIIDVAPTTTIVRRFDGPSTLSEVSAGDHLLITGANLGNHTIAATAIKDTSIQVGFTSINARVRYVARDFSAMAVRITANEHGNAAFGVGSTILVDITPTTPITLLQGAGTVQQLRPQMLINIHYGLSNREGQVMFTAHDITELPQANAASLPQVAPADTIAK
jgi:hypothetical protein